MTAAGCMAAAGRVVQHPPVKRGIRRAAARRAARRAGPAGRVAGVPTAEVPWRRRCAATVARLGHVSEVADPQSRYRRRVGGRYAAMSSVSGSSTKKIIGTKTSWPASGNEPARPDRAQWALLAPLLPAGTKTGRPPKWSRRQLIDGIRWRIRVGALARRAGVLRAVADRLRAVPALAARWNPAAHPDPTAGAAPTRPDSSAGMSASTTITPGAPARRPRAQKGSTGRNHPVASRSSRPTTGKAARAGAGPASCTWSARPGTPLSILITAGQRRQPAVAPVLDGIRVHLGVGRPCTARGGSWPISRTARGPTVGCCADAALPRSSPSSSTQATVRYTATVTIAAINIWLRTDF
jgi:hypothetical protein